MMIPHIHLSSTHSTNSQLIDWIMQSLNGGNVTNTPHFTQPHLLTADSQTSGRGQHGRTWQSPKGNVYLSLYIPTLKVATKKSPCLTQRLDGRLSLCIGYQLSQMSQILSLQKIGVKWVNDLGFYQHERFNKLAGILIEPVSVDNKLLGVVVGVGMNVAFAPDLPTQTQDNLNYQAVCLQDLLGQTLNPHNFYQPISQAILQAIKQFNNFNQPENVTEFLQKFNHIDILLGKNLQVPLADGQTLIGIAHGIDENGCLKILKDDGTITPIWTGTIQVLKGL